MENQFTHAAFTQYLAEHRLMGTRNRKSGVMFCPPRPIDPETHSIDMEWAEFNGTGRLEGFTVIYIAPSAMLAAGYDRKNPYCVGVVRLDEGPMISGLIQGVDVFHPETIKIGMSLKAAFIDRGEAGTKDVALAFEPY